LKAILLERITSGEYGPGVLIPFENERAGQQHRAYQAEPAARHPGTAQPVISALPVVAELFDTGAAYMTEQALVAAPVSCRDKLHVYLSSNMRFMAEHAAHLNAVHRIQENAGHGGEPDAVTPLAGLFAAGQTAGEFGSFDPEAMALAVRGVMDGASHHFPAHPELDIEHYIREAIQLFDRATAR
jgi:hypothetical protein